MEHGPHLPLKCSRWLCLDVHDNASHTLLSTTASDPRFLFVKSETHAPEHLLCILDRAYYELPLNAADRYLVCRLLLAKKKKTTKSCHIPHEATLLTTLVQ